MEIRTLNYFLTVARECNITKAADSLHITQPTLSRQLKQLEDELGTTLFIRGRRKVSLTDDGLALKRRAEEIVYLAQKIDDEVGNEGNEIAGSITIGVGLTEATVTMLKYMKEFMELYPRVSFNVRNENSSIVTYSIDTGTMDVGVVIDPIDIRKYESVHLKKDEVWGVLMRRDSPFAKKKSISVEDLKKMDLITSGRDEVKMEIRDHFGKDIDEFHFVAASSLLTTSAMMVENNFGNALVLQGSVKEALTEKVTCIPLNPPFLTKSHVIYKKYEKPSRQVNAFIEFIRKKESER